MGKAIIVTDMPDCCGECKMSGTGVCRKWNMKDANTFPKDCPLKLINPNLIKALRFLASQDSYGNCYVNTYNRNRGDKPEMSCKGLLGRIPCPYSQDEYNTDFGSDECGKWLIELADLLEGK